VEEFIPVPPKFSSEYIAECKSKGDLRHILFEYYKYIARLSNAYGRIDYDSPAIRKIGNRDYIILVAMLQRFARLMLSNLTLGQNGKNLETIGIIDRSIVESAVKTCWLCTSPLADRFDRFIADGFKADIELKWQLKSIIENRGHALVIENRMIKSIEKRISNSGFTEAQLVAIKKLPDVASMIDFVFKDRVNYVIEYKIGSHFVHGSWNDLMANYIEEEDGVLSPRQESREFNDNQFLNVATLVVEALKRFSVYVVEEIQEAENFYEIPKMILTQIIELYKEKFDVDFGSSES
jgi:hypothetical protein